MKNKMRFLTLAALAVVAVMMTGCTKENGGSMTLTTTVKMADDGAKALDADGVKTFATGEQIAVVYTNRNGQTVKVESNALTANDISGNGKVANFTVDLTDPDREKSITYIYPAAMANDDGSVNNAALNNQDGTLATLSSSLDLGTYTGSWNSTVTLTNGIAIGQFTIQNISGTDITSTITSLTVTNGTNTYTVTRSAAAGSIYVAMLPVTTGDIVFTATAGINHYTKAVSGKTLTAGHLYPVTVRMDLPVKLYGPFSIGNGNRVYFSQGNLKATTSDQGASWTWSFHDNQWDYVGGNPGNTTINGSGTVSFTGTVSVDFFGWVGSSASVDNYGIWNKAKRSTSSGNYGNGGLSDALKHDWGHNAITNGGNQPDVWRTLTIDEWTWILGPDQNPTPGTNCRESSTVNNVNNARFAKGTVNNKQGLIVFPDNYSHPDRVTPPTNINNRTSNCTGNNYSGDAWTQMEYAGCVFLPLAGWLRREQDGADGNPYNDSMGAYWSSSPESPNNGYERARCVYFTVSAMSLTWGGGRSIGLNVRLVKPAD